jgi:hypothetical protein
MRFAFFLLACFSLSVPIAAGTISYSLTDVESSLGVVFTGGFSIDATTGELFSYDILTVGGSDTPPLEWNPSRDLFDDSAGPSDVFLTACSPGPCSASAPEFDVNLYELFMSASIPLSDSAVLIRWRSPSPILQSRLRTIPAGWNMR